MQAFATDWSGTKYQWGGVTKKGIDCSGFVREMFRHLYDVELPRTTQQQVQLGLPIAIDPRRLAESFQPGDLIFFVDRAGIPNHVIVYVGAGQITHSASARGVIVEGLRGLWGRRIVARRLLVPPRGTKVTTPAVSAPVEISCPSAIRANEEEIRRLRAASLPSGYAFPEREICEWRALAAALERNPGASGGQNAQRIGAHIEWLESVQALGRAQSD